MNVKIKMDRVMAVQQFLDRLMKIERFLDIARNGEAILVYPGENGTSCGISFRVLDRDYNPAPHGDEILPVTVREKFIAELEDVQGHIEKALRHMGVNTDRFRD